MAKPPSPDDERAAEIRRTLDRVADESEVVGTSRLAATLRRAADHMAAADRRDDAVELWASRVGRMLGLAAIVALAAYLAIAYLL